MDVVYAWRALRKTPALTTVAVLCLSVAIGLPTAAFSVVHGAFLAPLPIHEGRRLVMVHDYHPSGGYNLPMTPARATFLRDRSESFDALGAWYSRNVTVSSGPQEQEAGGLVRAAYISPNALQMLGVDPLLGRHAADTDVAPGMSPVVILGYDVWRSRFGGDASILGRTVSITGSPHRVIGIMPQGFRFPIRDDLWIPVQMNARASNATRETLTMFGRLREGLSERLAGAELATLSASDERRDATLPAVVQVRPFTRGFMSPEEEWALYGFLLGLGLFLVVIAANLANLFFARNAARARAIALRAALGASRRRLVSGLFVESLVLGVGGAVAGLAVARVALTWFRSQVEDLPWWADFGLNPVVLGFVAVSALIASLVAGIGPAMRLTRVSVADALKAGASTSTAVTFSRIGAALIVAQVAISVGFLSVVGVLAQGLFGFSYEKYQLAAKDVLVAQVYLGAPEAPELSRPGTDRRQVWQAHFERSAQQFENIRERLRELPGIRHVTFSTHFPGNDVEAARIELGPNAPGGPGPVLTRIAEVGPEFFDTLGARILHGRDFAASDRSGPLRSVIVNAPFAQKFFPNDSPLGRTLRVVGEADAQQPGPWLEIVGVVPDLALNPGDPGRADGIYVPFTPSNFARLGVRTAAEPDNLIPFVHAVVLRENARAQVQSAGTLEAQMHTAQAVFRGLGAGLLLIGGTALALSAVSFYSLVSFGVTRRTREIGIRLALGATRTRILRSVVGRELSVIVTGAAAGVVLGAGIYRLVAFIPFDLRPAGPSLLAAFLGLMLLVGAGACLVPAVRAMSLEPADVLRHE